MKYIIEYEQTPLLTIGKIYKIILNAKPLITCEQCSKWKTEDCLHKRQALSDGQGESLEEVYFWTDPDDTCKDATPKDNQKEKP